MKIQFIVICLITLYNFELLQSAIIYSGAANFVKTKMCAIEYTCKTLVVIVISQS